MEEIVKQSKQEDRAKIHAARLKRLEEQRAKADEDVEAQTIPHTKSRIFRGNKILGHVTNHIPCVLRYVHRRRENFIVTCIGNSINTFASNKLSLLSVSGTVNTEISCMAGDTYHVYTAFGNQIYAWRRGVEVTHKYTTGHDSTIVFLLPFGEHLISIDEDGRLCMRDIKSEELTATVQFDSKKFKISAIMHPATYINKILLGSQQGTLQLWNVKKMKMVHLFSNWTDSSVLHIAQAPALDCVALALSKKRIVIHNLKYDATIMTLKCEDQPLTIGFRTDNVEAMVTGNSNGSITLWDLNTQEVLQHSVGCHADPVTGLQCYHQEPLFFTSSPDNSLKVWIFDGPGGTFRELCSRTGHSQPPGRIRFFGNMDYQVLSAGKDGRIRQFHIYNETINRPWGENKIPLDVCRRRGEHKSAIVDFTSQSIADPTHHDDVAILTEDEAAVTTWSSHTFKQGSSVLFPFKKRIPHPDFVATCLYLSSCGQFVVVGYDNGSVHRYNIQSGQHRHEYGSPNKAHVGSVRGVAIDSVNGCVASGGADNILKLWKFENSQIFREFDLPGGIASMFRHRQTSFLGVVLDNFEIIVVDMASHHIVREFKNISSPVQDAVFSPDCRWLTVSSSDCLVRTYDLPTGNMIDIFRMESIVTFMDYSSNGRFLITALSDNIGILLWSNRTLFNYVSLMPIPLDFEPPVMKYGEPEKLPEIQDPNSRITGYEYKSPEFLDGNLVTISSAPDGKWKNLLNLDLIRERNRPKQPAKQHVAPFFLPSELKLRGEDDPFGTKLSAPKIDGKGTNQGTSKILSINFAHSPFASGLLEKPKAENYHEALCKILESLGLSQIESEIIALGPEGGGSLELIEAFIIFLRDVITSRRHTDSSQAILTLFLRTHMETLRQPRFRKYYAGLIKTMDLYMEDFLKNAYDVLGYISFIKSGMY